MLWFSFFVFFGEFYLGFKEEKKIVVFLHVKFEMSLSKGERQMPLRKQR